MTVPTTRTPEHLREWLVTTEPTVHELLLTLHAEDPAHITAYAHNLGLKPVPAADKSGEIRHVRLRDGSEFLIWAPGPSSH